MALLALDLMSEALARTAPESDTVVIHLYHFNPGGFMDLLDGIVELHIWGPYLCVDVIWNCGDDGVGICRRPEQQLRLPSYGILSFLRICCRVAEAAQVSTGTVVRDHP